MKKWELHLWAWGCIKNHSRCFACSRLETCDFCVFLCFLLSCLCLFVFKVCIFVFWQDYTWKQILLIYFFLLFFYIVLRLRSCNFGEQISGAPQFLFMFSISHFFSSQSLLFFHLSCLLILFYIWLSSSFLWLIAFILDYIWLPLSLIAFDYLYP